MKDTRAQLSVIVLLLWSEPALCSVLRGSPAVPSTRRGAQARQLPLSSGLTLLNTRVEDNAGWCHISLVRPLFSGIVLLHMTLSGQPPLDENL